MRTARSLSSTGCRCPDPCLDDCCFCADMGYILPKNGASIKPRHFTPMPKFYVQHRPRPKQAGSGSKMASCGYPYLAEVTEQARGRPPTELEFPPTRGRAADALLVCPEPAGHSRVTDS